MSTTLVLNKNYQPINIVSWKRALNKVINGRAEIVYFQNEKYENFNFDGWLQFTRNKLKEEKSKEIIIYTENFPIIAPSVIRALYYNEVKGKYVKLTRRNLYTRDNYTCSYCGKKFKPNDLNIDHVIPRSKGGRHVWENVVCSCIKCNTKKSNMLLSECNMKLLKNPYVPFHNLINDKHGIDEEKRKRWGPFINNGYVFEGELKL